MIKAEIQGGTATGRHMQHATQNTAVLAATDMLASALVGHCAVCLSSEQALASGHLCNLLLAAHEISELVKGVGGQLHDVQQAQQHTPDAHHLGARLRIIYQQKKYVSKYMPIHRSVQDLLFSVCLFRCKLMLCNACSDGRMHQHCKAM